MAEAHNIEPQELSDNEVERIKWLASWDHATEGEPTYRWPRGSIEFDTYRAEFNRLIDQYQHRN